MIAKPTTREQALGGIYTKRTEDDECFLPFLPRCAGGWNYSKNPTTWEQDFQKALVEQQMAGRWQQPQGFSALTFFWLWNPDNLLPLVHFVLRDTPNIYSFTCFDMTDFSRCLSTRLHVALEHFVKI